MLGQTPRLGPDEANCTLVVSPFSTVSSRSRTVVTKKYYLINSRKIKTGNQ